MKILHLNVIVGEKVVFYLTKPYPWMIRKYPLQPCGQWMMWTTMTFHSAIRVVVMPANKMLELLYSESFVNVIWLWICKLPSKPYIVDMAIVEPIVWFESFVFGFLPLYITLSNTTIVTISTRVLYYTFGIKVILRIF